MNMNMENDNVNVLEKYGRDITESAKIGKIDPVIGRDDEIRDITRILSRKTKNNPVLIGEAGVGKTAIVEGLANRIISIGVSLRKGLRQYLKRLRNLMEKLLCLSMRFI